MTEERLEVTVQEVLERGVPELKYHMQLRSSLTKIPGVTTRGNDYPPPKGGG